MIYTVKIKEVRELKVIHCCKPMFKSQSSVDNN